MIVDQPDPLEPDEQIQDDDDDDNVRIDVPIDNDIESNYDDGRPYIPISADQDANHVSYLVNKVKPDMKEYFLDDFIIWPHCQGMCNVGKVTDITSPAVLTVHCYGQIPKATSLYQPFLPGYESVSNPSRIEYSRHVRARKQKFIPFVQYVVVDHVIDAFPSLTKSMTLPPSIVYKFRNHKTFSIPSYHNLSKNMFWSLKKENDLLFYSSNGSTKSKNVVNVNSKSPDVVNMSQESDPVVCLPMLMIWENTSMLPPIRQLSCLLSQVLILKIA